MPLNSLEAGSSFAVRPSNISLPLLPRWPSRSYLKWPPACTAMSNRRANVSPSVRPPAAQVGGQAGRGEEGRRRGRWTTAGSRRRALNCARGHHTPPLSLLLSSLPPRECRMGTRRTCSGRPVSYKARHLFATPGLPDRLVHKTRREMGTRTARWG